MLVRSRWFSDGASVTHLTVKVIYTRPSQTGKADRVAPFDAPTARDHFH